VTPREVGVQVGYLAAMFGVPAIGLICLIIGLRARNARPVTTGSPYPPAPTTAYPPQPRPAKWATTLVILGAVLLTLGALGIAGSLVRPNKRSLFDTDKSMRVGQCIDQNAFLARSFSSSPNNDCANPANTYELAFQGGPSASCPDGKRGHSVYNRYTDDTTLLCFALNLKQGRCYQLTNGAENLTMRPGDCSEQPLLTRVVQRIDGSTDTTRCPPGDKAIAYPVPARVYCLAGADS
jgi:hypothetical protein